MLPGFVVDPSKWMKLWLENLTQKIKDLVNHLNVDGQTEILLQLKQDRVLTEAETQTIEAGKTTRERCLLFLNIITTKSTAQIVNVIAAVRKTQQPMANTLQELYTETLSHCYKL